jgi:hypothetical protein
MGTQYLMMRPTGRRALRRAASFGAILGTAAVSALAAAASPPAASTTTVVTARSAIQAAYDAQNAAIARRDPAGALANETTDFVSVDDQGTVSDRATADRSARAFVSTIVSSHSKSVIQTITISKDAATVVIAETANLVVYDAAADINHKIAIHDTSRDDWVRRNGVWKMRRSQMLKDSVTVDGEPASAN